MSKISCLPVSHCLLLACVVFVTELTAQDNATMIPTDDAITLFESRIKKNEQDYASRTLLGRLHLRRAGEEDRFEDYVTAEAHFRKALIAKPDYLAARTYLASALSAQHRFSEAAEAAEEVLAAKPQSTMALASLADACLELGQWDRADQVLHRLGKLNQSPPVLVRQARLKELRGMHENAIALLRRAEEEHARFDSAGHGWYQWRIGRGCFVAGQLDEADRWFEAALKTNPDDAHSIAGRAAVSAARGDYELAITGYLAAVEKLPSPPLMAALGDVCERAGDGEQAVGWWDKAEAIIIAEAGDNSSRIAHAREAAVFFADHRRRLSLAVELARADLRQRQDPVGYDTLAWALHQSGKSRKAQEWIGRALEASQDIPKIHYHAGVIAYTIGDRTSAISHLQRALELNPHFSLRGTVIAGELLRTLEQDAS
ncbi:MAG: tetratricopeptide repeat protein [Planctomycetota bacterium]